jgi:hypothetical protein
MFVDLVYHLWKNQLRNNEGQLEAGEKGKATIISLHSKHFDAIQKCFQANTPAYLVAPKPNQVDPDDEGKEQ